MNFSRLKIRAFTLIAAAGTPVLAFARRGFIDLGTTSSHYGYASHSPFFGFLLVAAGAALIAIRFKKPYSADDAFTHIFLNLGWAVVFFAPTAAVLRLMGEQRDFGLYAGTALAAACFYNYLRRNNN